MNYYPFHIGDYLSATRHLSWEEDAAFRRLLDTYYTTEKPLPCDIKAVCRLVLATTPSQRESVETVLREFFQLTENGWINVRADQEIDAMRVKQQKQRDKANKRWQKPDPEHGNASAMPRHTETNAVASKNDANAMPPTPTPTPTPISVDKSTGDKSPADPIFGTGLKFLTGKGLDEKQARAFLGKLRKDAGEIVTLRALSDAIANDISDPVPWLVKATKSPSAVPERKPWN